MSRDEPRSLWRALMVLGLYLAGACAAPLACGVLAWSLHWFVGHAESAWAFGMVGLLIGCVMSIVLLANGFIAAFALWRDPDTHSHSICWKCGYSLQGDLEAPTCPECGALFR